MATKRKPNAKRGRPPTDPRRDAGAEVLADILALIPQTVRPDWNEEAWSSSHFVAIRRVVQSLNPDVVIPTTPDPAHNVKNHKGRLVNTIGYFNSLARRLNGLGPSYDAWRRDPASPQARTMVMASNRRWLHHAEERLKAEVSSDVLNEDIKTAGLISQLAVLHDDKKSVDRVVRYLQTALEVNVARLDEIQKSSRELRQRAAPINADGILIS